MQTKALAKNCIRASDTKLAHAGCGQDSERHVGGMDECRERPDHQGGMTCTLPAEMQHSRESLHSMAYTDVRYLVQVYLDRNGMVGFHKRVLHSQFTFWCELLSLKPRKAEIQNMQRPSTCSASAHHHGQ